MGALGSSLGRVILVDAASLVIFVLAFSWARLLRPRDLIMMLALFGAIEGAISMGQFGGSQPLWKFPETIATASGTPLTALMRERQTFEDVGRARGTQLFVHVFTSMEAVLAAFLLVAAAGARAAKVPAGRGYSWVLLIAAVVSFLGVVLSFSRSGVLGCVAVVPVALIGFRRTSRTRALLFLLLTGLAVLGANAALNVTAGAKYQRLFDYSSSNSNNAARLGVVELAWSAFIEAPLTGGGSDVGVGRSAIAIHSVPMRVLGSYGIVAFAAYIAVLASLAQTFWKRLRTATQWEQVAAVAGLAGLAAGLVDAFTHTSGLLMSDVAQAALLGTFLGAAWQAPAPAARRRAGPAA
jgi:O-antigen ligase